ncbi:uncharacterized protein LOC110458769 [Mizuhopecten yessoensis]|uniref:uncharacterized protein LOC110458769 n=1 Tax=Mizuhopecten yessoensis TaxID=6573 RepID=UPI000B45907A|nr:uncharacterized protein LOC110458769 [Mizuhopecten yessoensis]
MMLQTVLLVLCVSVFPVLGREVCLCTDSDVVIRKLPSPTASVTGKLATGSCLNVSQFERTGEWLKIVGNGIQTGYLLESDGVHRRSCPDHRSMRATSESVYCRHECPTECCGVHSGSPTHHHGVSVLSHWPQQMFKHFCVRFAPVWSHWGHCSVTCGVGTRHRHCTLFCSSLNSTQQTQICHHSACPVVNLVSDHVCDKVSVVQAVALQVAENCSGQGHLPFTPFVIQHCRAPASVADWVAGSKVSTSCNTLAMYSPVATFYNSGHHDIMTGVFVGCATNDEFKVITSSCGMSPQVMHISIRNGTFNHFYQVKW